MRQTIHGPPGTTGFGPEQCEWSSILQDHVGLALEHERVATNISIEAGHVAGDGGGAAGHSISTTAEITDARGAPEVIPLT